MSLQSRFAQVPMAPPVAIFELARRYKLDTSPNKVDLGIGAYRDESGKPWVLPVVKKARKLVTDDEVCPLNYEYLGQLGLPEFTSAAEKLLFGKDSLACKEGRVVSCQSISGTGALLLAATFLKTLRYKTVYYSEPTWPNHLAIFSNVGWTDIRPYRYWDSKKRQIDFEGMTQDLRNAPNDSVIIFHACGHNPTGMDPNEQQWKVLAEICVQNNLLPLFDSAYQGFVSGDPEQDASTVRYFEKLNIELVCCMSFAKNFGLYSERVGNLSIILKDQKSDDSVKSQLAVIVRKYYSNPPANGARIVAKVLGDPKLYKDWRDNIAEMSSRISNMRSVLRERIEALDTPGNWEHLTNQAGMFSYTGLSKAQVDYIIKEFHVYLPQDGRISMAGLNKSNVLYVAEAISKAVINVAGDDI